MQLSFTQKKHIRKNFGKLVEGLSIPNLIEVQKNSYTEFLKSKSLNEKQLAQLKMGSYLSVARGSIEPPRMIIIEYNGGRKNLAPAVLVLSLIHI